MDFENFYLVLLKDSKMVEPKSEEEFGKKSQSASGPIWVQAEKGEVFTHVQFSLLSCHTRYNSRIRDYSGVRDVSLDQDPGR